MKIYFSTDFSVKWNCCVGVELKQWLCESCQEKVSHIIRESFYLCLFSLLLPNEPNQTALVRWRQDGTFCYYELIFHLPITSYLPSDTPVTVLWQLLKDISYRNTLVPSLVIAFIPWMRESLILASEGLSLRYWQDSQVSSSVIVSWKFNSVLRDSSFWDNKVAKT